VIRIDTVGTLTRLRAGGSKNRCSIPRREKRFKFHKSSRPAVGPTEVSAQCISSSLSQRQQPTHEEDRCPAAAVTDCGICS
jgi:hypothetical protein